MASGISYESAGWRLCKHANVEEDHSPRMPKHPGWSLQVLLHCTSLASAAEPPPPCSVHVKLTLLSKLSFGSQEPPFLFTSVFFLCSIWRRMTRWWGSLTCSSASRCPTSCTGFDLRRVDRGAGGLDLTITPCGCICCSSPCGPPGGPTTSSS